MGYDGRAVANFVLDHCDAIGRQLSNLGLQKVIYFCHVWSLIELDRPLVRHAFEAWEYGPVLPYLYHEFKHFRDGPIASRAKFIDRSSGQSVSVPYDFERHEVELLRRIVAFYARMNSFELIKLSHVPGGPWDAAWNHREVVNPGMQIDNHQIKSFYSSARTALGVQ